MSTGFRRIGVIHVGEFDLLRAIKSRLVKPRFRVMAHIVNCTVCYRRWEMASPFTSEEILALALAKSNDPSIAGITQETN